MENAKNNTVSEYKNCKRCTMYLCTCQIKKDGCSTFEDRFPINIITQKSFVVTEDKLFTNRKYLNSFINPKFSEVMFEDFVGFGLTHSNKNKNNCNYLPTDSEVSVNHPMTRQNVRTPKNIVFLADYRDFNAVDYYVNFFHDFKLLSNRQITSTIRTLYSMFTKHCNLASSFHCNSILQSRRDCHFLSRNLKIISIDKEDTFNWENLNKRITLHLYQDYFLLLSEYNFLENINNNLLIKINDLKVKVNAISLSDDAVTFCKACSEFEENLQNLKDKYTNILRSYSISQSEKERMVMKYATSEKRLIEVQRSLKLLDNKHQEVLKENVILKKKIQKAHGDIIKLSGEINTKYSDLTQLRSQIEYYKDNDNATEMKLKWTQNRLKLITDAHEDMQVKVNESLVKNSELANEVVIRRSQTNKIMKEIQNPQGYKVAFLDQQLKEQQACLLSGRHLVEDSESSHAKQVEYDSLLTSPRFAGKENHSLILQIQTLQKECSEYQSKLNTLNVSAMKGEEEIKNLKSQLSGLELLNKRLESNGQRLCKMESELQHLYFQKAELQLDIDAYRQREFQMLDFTQKLTDKNVQLQCEFTNLQTKLHFFEDKQILLYNSIDKFTTKIKNLEYNLSSEKVKRIQECEMLSKYIAEQTIYNRKLLHLSEYSEGENVILRRRYELAIREMTRELHLSQSKLKSNELYPSITLSRKSICYRESLLNEDSYEISITDKRNEKHKIYVSDLEREKLFNQIIKLQQINVKRAEKLDFLEEHSHALLRELQKKSKIIQYYNDHINSEKK